MITKKIPTRRPSRAEIARSLQDLEKLWRPPDPENDDARSGGRGTGGTKLPHNAWNSTPLSDDRQSRRGWPREGILSTLPSVVIACWLVSASCIRLLMEKH